VNLRPIDPDKLEIIKVPGTKETFKFNLLLEMVPDTVWKDFFYDELRKNPIPLDCEVDFEGLSIYVLSTPDKINDIIESVKKLVNSTNEHVQQHNKRIEEENEIEREMNVEDEEKIKRMREALKK
jgi:molybdopterin converting factor small subunit